MDYCFIQIDTFKSTNSQHTKFYKIKSKIETVLVTLQDMMSGITRRERTVNLTTFTSS